MNESDIIAAQRALIEQQKQVIDTLTQQLREARSPTYIPVPQPHAPSVPWWQQPGYPNPWPVICGVAGPKS